MKIGDIVSFQESTFFFRILDVNVGSLVLEDLKSGKAWSLSREEFDFWGGYVL